MEEDKYHEIAQKAKIEREERQKIYEWKQKYIQLNHRINMMDHGKVIELDDLQNALGKVRWEVQRFQGSLEEIYMDKAEKAIKQFKLMQMGEFEELALAENELNLELEIYKDKILNVEVRRPPSTKRVVVVSKQSKDDLQHQIESIDETIAQLGGFYGNWDKRDHAEFLRLISRFKIPESVLQDMGFGVVDEMERFVDKFLEACPSFSSDEILDHFKWYGTYLFYVAKKKEIVKEWKNSKKENDVVIGTEKEEEKEVKVPLQKSKQFRLAEKVSVKEWKQARDAEKQRNEKVKQAESNALRKINQGEALRRREEKERIALYKLQKEAENFTGKPAKVKSTSIAILKERQEKAMELAVTRRSVIQQKNAELDRATRIAKLKVKAVVPERSSSVVDRTTQAFEQRKLTREELGELQQVRAARGAHEGTVASTSAASKVGRSYSIGVQNMVSGRSVPSWRRI